MNERTEGMSEREKIIETMVSALTTDDKNWAGWKNTSSGILAALDAAGYAIVPREPDEAIKFAGGIAFEDAAFGEQKLVFNAAGDAYRAMIAKHKAPE